MIATFTVIALLALSVIPAAAQGAGVPSAAYG